MNTEAGCSISGGTGSAPENSSLANEEFWPDIDTEIFYSQYRVSPQIDPGLIENTLCCAMAQVNCSVSGWKDKQAAAGYKTLEEVPSPKINDVSVKVMQYKRAVYCTAKASVIGETPELERSRVADNMAKTADTSQNTWLAWADYALCQMMDQPKIYVESL